MHFKLDIASSVYFNEQISTTVELITSYRSKKNKKSHLR